MTRPAARHRATPQPAPSTAPAVLTAWLRGWRDRNRMVTEGRREIDELTGDAARRERSIADAATYLTPGPWALGLLFRQQRPPERGDQRSC